MENPAVVAQFLTAYQEHKAKAMAAYLDSQVEFHDMAFPSLKGEDVRAMWRWFCQPFGERTAPIEVPGFQILEASGDRVIAEYWIRYSPKPGRNVNYVIRSEFLVRNGRIVSQTDTPVISKFEVARMAAGLIGALLVRLTPWKMGRKFEEFKKSEKNAMEMNQ